MNRYLLAFSLGVPVLVVSPGCCRSEELQPPGKATLNNQSKDRLCVTIWPKVTRIQTKKAFEVTLRVVNATEKVQSFEVMCCSWDDHWKTDNTRLTWVTWSCTKNHPVTIKLEPGESYEATLQMMLKDGPFIVTTSFQMGFTPIGEKTTYWSNKVVLGIKPGKRK